MNKGRNTHAPYMTFTALNHWTILLLDITHWLANSTRELCSLQQHQQTAVTDPSKYLTYSLLFVTRRTTDEGSMQNSLFSECIRKLNFQQHTQHVFGGDAIDVR